MNLAISLTNSVLFHGFGVSLAEASAVLGVSQSTLASAFVASSAASLGVDYIVAKKVTSTLQSLLSSSDKNSQFNKMSKEEPMFDADSTPMYRRKGGKKRLRRNIINDLGTFNYQQQRGFSKTVVGRSVNVNKMLMLEAKMGMKYSVYRWQSLGQFDEGCGVHQLSVSQRPGTAASVTPAAGPWAGKVFNVTMLPMYAFNLTARPFGGMALNRTSSSVFGTLPMYQQARVRCTSVGYEYTQYLWLPLPGQSNAPTGASNGDYNFNYSVEDSNDDSQLSDSVYYRHHWSQVDLMLYGASQRPNKVKVQTVQFYDGDLAPPRLCYETTITAGLPSNLTKTGVWTTTKNGSSVYNFDGGMEKLPLGDTYFGGTSVLPYDDEKTQNHTASFDAFWSRKTGHPLRSSKSVVPVDLGYRVLSRDTIILPAHGKDDNDPAPKQHRHLLFLNGGGLINTENAVHVVDDRAAVTVADWQSRGYNSILSANSTTLFGKPEQDKYLLVYSTDHDTNGNTDDLIQVNPPFTGDSTFTEQPFYVKGPGVNLGQTPHAQHAAFDIVVRSKFSSY